MSSIKPSLLRVPEAVLQLKLCWKDYATLLISHDVLRREGKYLITQFLIGFRSQVLGVTQRFTQRL